MVTKQMKNRLMRLLKKSLKNLIPILFIMVLLGCVAKRPKNNFPKRIVVKRKDSAKSPKNNSLKGIKVITANRHPFSVNFCSVGYTPCKVPLQRGDLLEYFDLMKIYKGEKIINFRKSGKYFYQNNKIFGIEVYSERDLSNIANTVKGKIEYVLLNGDLNPSIISELRKFPKLEILNTYGSNLKSLRYIANLKHLSLSCGRNFKNKDLVEVKNLHTLTSLEITLRNEAAGRFFFSIISHMGKLKKLAIHWYLDREITKGELQLLGKLGKLNSLSLTHIGDRSFRFINKMKNLKFLALYSVGEFTDIGLQKLQNLDKLEILNISSTRIGNKSLKFISSKIKNLWNLQISGHFDDTGCRDIGKLTKLAVLYLDSDRITGKVLKKLKKLNSLACLRLSCKKIRAEDFLSFTQFPNLTSLQISICENDEGILYLKNCAKLKTLIIRCRQITGKGLKKIYKLGLEHVSLSGDKGEISLVFVEKKLPTLKRLSLRNAIKAGTTSNLKKFPALEYLYLGSRGGYPRLDKNILLPLSKLSHLQYLRMDNAIMGTPEDFRSLAMLKKLKAISPPKSIEDDHMAFLRNHKHIEFVDLSYTNITGKTLEVLSTIKTLRVLKIHGTRVTNPALKYLEKNTNLERLYLNETRVSLQGLMYLTKLPKLSYLELSAREIGKKELAILRKKLKGCQVATSPY